MVTPHELPVILKFYDLVLWTLNHTARFPRHHRYSPGQRIEGTLQDLLDVLIEARYAHGKRLCWTVRTCSWSGSGSRCD